MDELRHYARQAMRQTIGAPDSEKARVYQVAMETFPPGDPVFSELAAIGSEPPF
jgi:uncharacterized membrane protein